MIVESCKSGDCSMDFGKTGGKGSNEHYDTVAAKETEEQGESKREEKGKTYIYYCTKKCAPYEARIFYIIFVYIIYV